MLQSLGGAPTSKKDNGKDHYTLPAIHDSSTGKVITDSYNIAVYLDEVYPDKPALFPFSTKAAIATLDYLFMTTAGTPLSSLMLPSSCLSLNPRSEEYFRKTREESYKKKLEEFSPAGPVREKFWSEVEQVFTHLAHIYDRNGADKPFFLGDTFSYAECIIAGFLMWIKIILGKDNEEWKAVESWDNGRWGQLLERLAELVVVV